MSDIEAIQKRCKEVGHVLGSCSLEGDFKPGLLGELHGYVQALLAALDAVTGERDKWKRALHGLTPGGSEYATDSAECVAYVREVRSQQHGTIMRFKAERDVAVRERDHLKEKVAHYDRWLSKGVYFTTEEYAEKVKEVERLRAALEAFLALATGQHVAGPQHLEARRKVIDQARAALDARGVGMSEGIDIKTSEAVRRAWFSLPREVRQGMNVRSFVAGWNAARSEVHMEHEQRAREIVQWVWCHIEPDSVDASFKKELETDILDTLQQVERETIERCAKVAEGPGGYDLDNNDQLQRRIAQAIRAMGQEHPKS